jgi:hypothetical protein
MPSEQEHCSQLTEPLLYQHGVAFHPREGGGLEEHPQLHAFADQRPADHVDRTGALAKIESLALYYHLAFGQLREVQHVRDHRQNVRAALLHCAGMGED